MFTIILFTYLQNLVFFILTFLLFLVLFSVSFLPQTDLIHIYICNCFPSPVSRRMLCCFDIFRSISPVRVLFFFPFFNNPLFHFVLACFLAFSLRLFIYSDCFVFIPFYLQFLLFSFI